MNALHPDLRVSFPRELLPAAARGPSPSPRAIWRRRDGPSRVIVRAVAVRAL